MLRIAMITDHAEPGDRIDGGVQAVTRYLVEALVRRGDVDLHVLSFKYGGRNERTVEAEGYTHHVLAGARLGTLTAFRRDQRSVNHRLQMIQPDVVHGQGAGHNGILAARSHFPSVITVHGIMAEETKHMVGLGKRARHALLSRISDKYCISRGRHTILISPYVGDYFGDRLKGQRHYVPNPIADSFFSIARHEVVGRVLFAGRIHKLKGVLDLVRALSRVARSREVELHLAGSLHDQDYVAIVKKTAAELSISERVRFLGLLELRELQRELAEAAVLVLPSYQETAPMVVVEAMAAGVPVIATDVGGTRHLIEEGISGFLVSAGNIQMLADRLTTLLSNDAIRNRLSEAARRTAGDTYRPDRIAAQTVELYRQVLAERGI